MYGKVATITSGGGGTRHIPDIKINELPQRTFNGNNASLPCEVYNGGVAIEYHGQIHLMGGRSGATLNKYHHTWDGDAWTKQADLPFKCINSGVVVYKDAIHVIGGESNLSDHWMYKNGAWVQASDMPFTFQKGAVVVYRDCIHVMGGLGNKSLHYKWDGIEWTEVGSLLLNFDSGCAEVMGDVIHLMGNGDTPATYGKRHYVYDGTEWTQEENLPFSLYNGGSAKIGNYIYIFGGSGSSNSYYRYNGTWENLGNLPYRFLNGAYCTYKGQPVILSTSYSSSYYQWAYILPCTERQLIFKLDKNEIVHARNEVYNGYPVETEKLADTPYWINKGSAVAYRGEIHLLGGTQNSVAHYKFNKQTGEWEEIGKLPHTFLYDGAFVMNDEIHIIYGTSHSKYNGVQWETVSAVPYNLNQGSAIGLNGVIHTFGGSIDELSHYTYDGTQWTRVANLPFQYINGRAVIYNGKIHLVGSSDNTAGVRNKMAVLNDDGTWTVSNNLPIEFYSGSVQVADGKIHMLGNDSTSDPFQHFVYDGTKWSDAEDLPFGHKNGASAVVDGIIHIMGSTYDTESRQLHYSLKGIKDTGEEIITTTAPVTIEKDGNSTYMEVTDEGYFLEGQTLNGAEMITESGWHSAELPLLIE